MEDDISARLRFLLARLAQAIVTLLAVAIFNFALVHLAPGTPVDVLAGETGSADPARAAQLVKEFALDKPLWVQFATYMSNVAQLNLGFSYTDNVSVVTLIGERLGATLLLMASSITLAVGLGVVFGVIASWRVNTFFDQIVSFLCILFYATPLFWSGLMFIILFSVKLDWFPSSGMMTIGFQGSFIETVIDILHHLILPTISLSLFYIALYTRLMRSSMLEVSKLDYIRAARARGLRESVVYFHHALRNAMLPMVTMVGIQIGAILGGAVIVETTYSWPGLGRLAFDSVTRRDYNLLMAVLLFSSLIVMVVNLIVDIIYTRIDPRIRLAGN